MRRPLLFHTTILCATLLATAACTDNTIVELPSKKNSIVISGREYTPTRLLYGPLEITYPPDEAAESGVSIRLMAAGVTITAEMPMRLVGNRIDLASRERNPRPGEGIYFSFVVSARATPEELAQEPPVNPPGTFCRILSWGTTEERDSGVIPYGGFLTLTRGQADGEWIVEWEIVELASEKSVSKGYVKNIFEKTIS